MPRAAFPCALLLATAVASGVPSAAAAMTEAEAARINMQLAMTLCIRNYHDPAAIRPAFEAAGFRYQPEVYSPQEVLHWYAAPADTALALVIPGEGHSGCMISTTHMTVSDALPFAGQVLDQLVNAPISAGEVENVNVNIIPGHPEAWRRACSGYSVIVPRRMIVVRVGNAGQDPRCIDDGTAQIMISM